jgi:hypothetical protein
MSTANFQLDLDLGRNALGEPLSPGVWHRLSQAVGLPGQDTWDNAYSIVLNRGGTTLWQAVLVVDPGFASAQAPVTRWVPDAEDCTHPDTGRDFRGLGAGCWEETCGTCGSARPVCFPGDCTVCDAGEHHTWQPDPARAHESRTPWSRTPDAKVLRQAIAFATH